LAHLGEIKELAARADAVRVLAEQHDDRFTVQMIDLGRPTLIGLAQDRVGATIERANQALAWAPGDYNTQHYWHFLSLIEAYLYQGEFDAAWQLTVDAWPAHKKNHFLSVAFARDELLLARARAALGKASALKARGGATRELEMLRQVGLAAARKLQRNGLDSGKGWAELLRGVAHYLVDEIAPARAAFTRALGIFEAREMKTFRETARFWLGSLAGSTAGADAVEQAMSWMREQGVEKPLSMMRMLAGVIPDEPKQLSPG
jgi:tetratricopeptide (TPR) repeat protein